MIYAIDPISRVIVENKIIKCRRNTTELTTLRIFNIFFHRRIFYFLVGWCGSCRSERRREGTRTH